MVVLRLTKTKMMKDKVPSYKMTAEIVFNRMSPGDQMKATRAVSFVDGDYTYPQSDSKENKNVRIIVATGNVTINADFTGTIIAGKKIFVNKQCTVSNCPQEIFKALLLKEVKAGSKTMHLYDVFDDGADYLGGITKTAANGSGDADIDYSSLITYQNWKKN